MCGSPSGASGPRPATGAGWARWAVCSPSSPSAAPPVCNKLVLVLLGASGAMSYWAPLQPLLAVLSVGLLAEAALRRLSSRAECPVPASA